MSTLTWLDYGWNSPGQTVDPEPLVFLSQAGDPPQVQADVNRAYDKLGIPGADVTFTVQRRSGRFDWSTVASNVPHTTGVHPVVDRDVPVGMVQYYRILVQAGTTTVRTYTDQITLLEVTQLHELTEGPAWRFCAQNVRTGEWLAWGLPFTDVSLTWQLSGPNTMTATLQPEYAEYVNLFTPWQTAIYVEEEGSLRWGGICSAASPDGAALNIECTGFAGYPTGMTYNGHYKKKTVDPLDVVREIWRHLQSYDNGDLGMEVDGTTSTVLVGKVDPDDEDEEPYELAWWEATDCGDEIDQLAKDTPFDYTEDHSWYGDNVRHFLRLGFPRIGARTDRRLEIGVNVAEDPSLKRLAYANTGLGVGKGEGRKAIRVELPHDDGRLRRTTVVTDSSVGSKKRLRSMVAEALRVNSGELTTSDVTVIDHPNARIGEIGLGDDLLLAGDVPWLADPLQLRVRVLSITLATAQADVAQLKVARSDSFAYGSTETSDH